MDYITKRWIVSRIGPDGVPETRTRAYHQHCSVALAQVEAKRLIKENPQLAFGVFELVEALEANALPIRNIPISTV